MSDVSSAGIARGPRATARPAARMFFAALMSRSCRVRQDGHVQCRVDRLSSASRCPHAEQVLLDGIPAVDHDQFATVPGRTCTRAGGGTRPSRSPRSPGPACGCGPCSSTCRSSITIVSAERTRRVLARCRKSRRALRTLRWARATFAFALARFARAFPAAGHAPLVAGQVAGLALQVARVGDPLPVAGHGEVLHAEVNADRMPGRRQRLRVAGVDGEGHVPAAVRLPGHDHHRRVQRWSRPRPATTTRTAAGRSSSPAAARRRAWRTPTGCSARTGGTGGT